MLEGVDLDPKHRKAIKEGIDGLYNECGGLVIVNANDATWKGEVEADNDDLSAKLYELLGAELIITLSDVDGLMCDFQGDHERVISRVGTVDDYIRSFVKESSNDSTGGMETKLQAAELVLKNNGKMVICNGKETDIILEVIAGEQKGTYFG